MKKHQLRCVLEGALMAYGQPLTEKTLRELFVSEEDPDNVPDIDDIRSVLHEIKAECTNRGYELVEVASGWRYQVVAETAPWVNRLWDEKPPKYSRATLETLAIIAYRQPITRGDIEDIRGVAVSTNIIRSLTEREWIKVVGHKEVPGRPSLYATTKEFLDYFNMSSLEQLPSLKELTNLDALNTEALEDTEEAIPVNVSMSSGDEEQENLPDEHQETLESESSNVTMDNILELSSHEIH